MASAFPTLNFQSLHFPPISEFTSGPRCLLQPSCARLTFLASPGTVSTPKQRRSVCCFLEQDLSFLSFSYTLGAPAEDVLESPILSLLQELAYLLGLFTRVKVKSLSLVRLFATPWTVAYQAPPSMGFSRQEYWSGVPFPSLGDLPNPGIEPGSPNIAGRLFTV